MTSGAPWGRGVEDRLRALAEATTGRPCLMAPSGRLAIYLALRHWFRPGDRLLMSPVNDDVILFVVLAAGLHTVSAPVSPWTGNIDVAAVPDRTWRSVAGVLTANLYGVPDAVVEIRDRCDLFGLTLIEDACHALDVDVHGLPVGTFGAAGAFSLSKHAGARAGGFLALEDAHELPALERLRDEVTSNGSVTRDVVTVARSVARRFLQRRSIGGRIWSASRNLHLLERSGGYRMPLRPDDLDHALASAPNLDAFDSWVRIDLARYRRRPSPLLTSWLHKRLRSVAAERQARLDGVARLAMLPCAAPAIGNGPLSGEAPWPLFRVPLLIHHRDDIVAALGRRGVVTGYIYDPPLDDYAGTRSMEPSPSPDAARWFTRHVLPCDPLGAERIVDLLDELQAEGALWPGAYP